MKNIKIVLFMLSCALACMACQNNNDVGNKELPTLNGDYLTLKLNETGIVPTDGSAMTVSFVGVSDERCDKPSCYLCYGSKADILLSIASSKHAKVKINLSIVGCIDEYEGNDGPFGGPIDALGYRFQLVKLSPYPDIDPINKNDYTAKIKITKL